MEPMTYQQALAYLYAFADFERTGVFKRDPEENLPRMRRLLAALGDPQRAYLMTHIAGTKGKGSSAALIAAALTASGVSTGLYTQPDLHTFRERIQIAGQPVSEATVAALVPEVAAAVAVLSPEDRAQMITFEVGTALAFLAFARAGVQHAVIEVGLGGRLDATNVIQPLVGVITSISLDHTAILGSTIAQIAREKAGIIKPGMTGITSATAPDALRVIAEACATQGVRLVRVGPEASDADYRYPASAEHHIATTDDLMPPPFAVQTPHGPQELQIALIGAHQRENATAALAALDALREHGVPVTAAGFRAARWPGRIEVVAERPWLVIDGAHNADSMARLLTAVTTTFAFRRLIVIAGIMRDKDAAGIVDAIAAHHDRVALLITTTIHTPRALPAEELAERFAGATFPVRAITQSGDALQAALAAAAPEDLVLVAGSLYLAGEALRWGKAHLHGPLAERITIAGNDHGAG